MPLPDATSSEKERRLWCCLPGQCVLVSMRRLIDVTLIIFYASHEARKRGSSSYRDHSRITDSHQRRKTFKSKNGITHARRSLGISPLEDADDARKSTLSVFCPAWWIPRGLHSSVKRIWSSFSPVFNLNLHWTDGRRRYVTLGLNEAVLPFSLSLSLSLSLSFSVNVARGDAQTAGSRTKERKRIKRVLPDD